MVFVPLLFSCNKLVRKSGQEVVEEAAQKSAKKIAEKEMEKVGRSSSESALDNMLRKSTKYLTEEGLNVTAKMVRRLEGDAALEYLKKANPKLYSSLLESMRFAFQNDYFKKRIVCEVMDNGDVIVYNSAKEALSSKIIIHKGVVYAESGCTKKCGATNKFLDHVMADMKYVVDKGKQFFKTDKLGRTVYAEADRTLPPAEIKPNLDEYQRDVTRKLKNGRASNLDDAGHILQRNEGGLDEAINLVPMDNKWQRSGGLWRETEQLEEKLILEAREKGAKKIISRRKLIYDGDSKRPSKIIVELVVDGKTVLSKVLVCPK